MKTIQSAAVPANGAVCPVVPNRLEMARIRAALIERIDAAAEKAKWGRNLESEGMPSRLFAAGCFLAAHGYDDQPCEGERWFNTDFASYRAFAAFDDMIETGRRAIYEGGRRTIAPVEPMEMAA